MIDFVSSAVPGVICRTGILIVLHVLFLVRHLCAQSYFEKKYSLDLYSAWADHKSNLILLPDSGYGFAAVTSAIGGGTVNISSSGYGLIIGRLSSTGNVIWVKQIDNGMDLGSSPGLTYDPDGHFYLTYSVRLPDIGNYGSVLLKLDNSGNLIYARCFAPPNIIPPLNMDQYCKNVFTTSSSIYLAGEMSYNNQNHLYVMKLNKNGGLLWGKFYGIQNCSNFLEGALQLNNKELFLSGTAYDNMSFANLGLMRLDSNGNVQWSKKMSMPSIYEFSGHAVDEDNNGNIIIAGSIDSLANGQGFGRWDMFLMKLGAAGNLKWAKYYGKDNYDETYNVKCTPDNGFIMAAEPESFGNISRISLMKLDSMGNIQWMNLYGNASGGFANEMVINSDRGYTILAHEGNYADVKKMHVVGTDVSGNTTCPSVPASVFQSTFNPLVIDSVYSGTFGNTKVYTPVTQSLQISVFEYCVTTGEKEWQRAENFSIYPNPASNWLNLRNLNGSSLVSICDLTGKELISAANDKPEFKIDVSRLEKGIYFLQVRDNDGSKSIKFIKD